MFKNKLGTIVPAGLVGLSLVVMPLIGAEDQKTEKKPATAAAPAKPSANKAPGMVVVKDPITGELRAPTAAEAAQLGATPGPGQNNASTGGRAIAGPGGAVGLTLDGSTDVFAVATRNPDGSISIGEATGPAAARAAVIQPVKPVAKGAANEVK